MAEEARPHKRLRLWEPHIDSVEKVLRLATKSAKTTEVFAPIEAGLPSAGLPSTQRSGAKIKLEQQWFCTMLKHAFSHMRATTSFDEDYATEQEELASLVTEREARLDLIKELKTTLTDEEMNVREAKAKGLQEIDAGSRRTMETLNTLDKKASEEEAELSLPQPREPELGQFSQDCAEKGAHEFATVLEMLDGYLPRLTSMTDSIEEYVKHDPSKLDELMKALQERKKAAVEAKQKAPKRMNGTGPRSASSMLNEHLTGPPVEWK